MNIQEHFARIVDRFTGDRIYRSVQMVPGDWIKRCSEKERDSLKSLKSEDIKDSVSRKTLEVQ
jgi:hypothetical protein